ncbi:putative bifunctional diguanylate cyclase/phosphodiesterase [Erythrobacter sp. GH1-10]|uniref:putative bifunctional diguanylate cyclase/phosphodiesterase n=1 Tax=Erythrobacter sp. GH1-10 TaxID=3349334 RepID=UPI0038783815
MARLLSRLANQTKFQSASGRAAKVDPRRRAALLESVENSHLGWFWETDAAGRLTYLSPAAQKVLDKAEDAVIGSELTDLFFTDEKDISGSAARPLNFRLASHSPFSRMQVKVKGAKPDVWWEISANPRLEGSGRFAGYHGTARDITGERLEARDAEKLSQFDSLTGLANRLRMARQLEQTLSAFRMAKRSCAIMMFDLDRFKQVNDTLGHPAGDELLKQVADRTKQIFAHRGEIGRLGGDEFQIILPDMDDRGELGELAKRLVQMVSQPYSIAGARAIIGCSIGIAVAPFDGIDGDELVKAADLALYAAKDSGRGTHRFYSSELSNRADFRQRIEDDLRDALVKGELSLFYQPIVDAKNHEVCCLEALLRWDHSERGYISPADFVPVAEEVGIMSQLGEWVLAEACRQLSEWPRQIRAAINVSPVQFASDDFPDMVRKTIKASGVDPARIELEITESVFVGDLDRTLRLFRELKSIGVRLALDDFGTGYSSLSYLRDAPFDKLKIDKTFVRGCSSDTGNNSALVAAIVSMAKALGMETVAEGVETQDELDMVVRQGACRIQGHLFSGALSPEQLVDRFAREELKFEPVGPEKYRSERRTEFRKIGLIHENSRYNVFLRNLSKTGALIEGLLDVPVGTDVVLDLGGGQLVVATVRRSKGFSQGVEFETQLISDGAGGLCTRHRVSPYQIEAAGRPLRALNDAAVADITGANSTAQKAFIEVDMTAATNRNG